MATIDYDPLNEEENFTSGSLNTRFDELAGSNKGVNAIPVSAIAKNSLQHHQVPSLVPTQDITSNPAVSDHGQSRSWSVEFHPNGNVEYNGGSYLVGDRHVVKGGSAQPLRIDFPAGIKMGMGSGTDGVKGLLVLANIHVMNMVEVRFGMTEADPPVAIPNGEKHYEHTLVFAIEIATSSAALAGLETAWTEIRRTRRSLSQVSVSASGSLVHTAFDEPGADTNQSMRFDVPLRSLLSASDGFFDGSDQIIYGVRIVCYPHSYGGATWMGDERWTTRAANLSVIPFHAGGTIV